MRLFVAVYPSSESLKLWREFQKRAPKLSLRWTDEAFLHITLKFLGKTLPEQEQKINRALELQLKSGGVFPPKGSPSIFWIGVHGNTEALIDLATVISKEMKALGFPEEAREYHPHVTVARPNDKQTRLRGEDGRGFSDWISGFSAPAFIARELCLVESRPGPTGSTYVVRRGFPFAGHS